MAFNGVIKCFVKFETHNLDGRVVNEVFENDNIEEYEELNSVLEDNNMKLNLQQSNVELRQLKTAGNVSHGSFSQEQNVTPIDNECELWTICVENGINMKALIVILNGLMKHANKKTANFDEIENGIISACLYLNLLSLPGSNAFGLFQPYCYINVLDTFRLQGILNGIAPNKKSSKSPQKRGKKPNSIDDNDNIDSQSEISDETPLTFDECCYLLKQILELGDELRRFVSVFSLDSQRSSLDLTIERLCIQIGKNSAVDEGAISQFDTTTICLTVLKALCNGKHGEIKDILLIIFKNIIDLILNTTGRLIINFLCQLLDSLSPQDTFYAVRRLIQNLCCRSPERADSRAKVSSIVLVFLTRLPVNEYVLIVKWFTGLLSHGKPGYRLIALEIIHLILGRPCVNINENSNSRAYYASKTYLMKSVLKTCSDKVSIVRAKALNLFGTCLTDSQPGVRQVVCQMLSNTENNASPRHQMEDEDIESENLTHDDEEMCQKDCVLKWKLITPLIHRRIGDANVYVRKAAIQVLHSVFLTSKSCVTMEDLCVLKSRCSDASVLVRKQALNAMSSVLNQYPELEILHKEWLEGVLPVVFDNESSCQEKCIEMIEDVLLNNVKSGKFTETPSTCLVWDLLNLITVSNEKCRFDLCLKKAISLLSSAGRLNAGIVTVLKGHIGTRNNNAAWMLLSIIIPFVKLKNLDFVWEYWEENKETLLKIKIPLVWIVQIMGAAIVTLKEDQSNHYVGILASLLEEGNCPLYVIPVLVDTMAKAGKGTNQKSRKKRLKAAYKDILKRCEDYLSSALLKKSENSCDQNIELISKYLLTLGDVGQLCPTLISKNMTSLLTSALVFNSVGREGLISNDENRNERSQDCLTRLEILKLVPEIVYLSLGKLSICNEELAKQCIATLSRQLADSQTISIKRAIISIMADFCVRYGTLVDRYLPLILGCLKDQSYLVRNEVVGVLTSLLKEDFLRWRGPLYFCFVTTILDENEAIRKLSKYNLEHILRKRNPRIFSMHFIECLFFFNSYQAKKGKGQAQTQMQRDYKQFSISGATGRKNRMLLYKFMIEHMVDDERILISGQLCNDILKQIIEGTIVLRKSNGEIDSTSEELVSDALSILRSDEMRLSHQKPQEDAEDHGEGAAGSQAEGIAPAVVAQVDTVVKKVVMTQMMKKNTLEIIVPVVLECKRKIEEQKSPLLKDIMLYLRDVMRHYKNEMKEMLAEDKNLAAEIEYDMKQLDQMEADDSVEDDETPAPPIRTAVQVPVTTIAAAVNLDVPAPQNNAVVASSEQSTVILNRAETQPSSEAYNYHLKDLSITIEPMTTSIRKHTSLVIRSPVVKITRIKRERTSSEYADLDESAVQNESPALPQSGETSPASETQSEVSIVPDTISSRLRNRSPGLESVLNRAKSKSPETTSFVSRSKSPVSNAYSKISKQTGSKSRVPSTRLRGKSPVTEISHQIATRTRSGLSLNPTRSVQNGPSENVRSKGKRKFDTIASTPVEKMNNQGLFGGASICLSPISESNTTNIEKSLRIDDEKSHFIANDINSVSSPPIKRRTRPTQLFK